MTEKKKQGKKETPRQSSGQPADKSVNWEDIAKRALADLDNYKKQAEKDKFEMLNNTGIVESNKTFTIILPNLIHKSKKRNLH